MKFNSDTLAYIEGRKFSNGLDIDFSKEKYVLKSRIEKILELTKNKKVIHIGFADHLPLIEEKIATNRWLHGLLLKNCTRCVGIDINQEAVDYLKENHAVPDIFYADIEKESNLQEILKEEKWDYILLGEVIEHVDNPVFFLRRIHLLFNQYAESIIVTAPNAFNNLTSKDIKRNNENINTDHRYWFSPFTLAKILSVSGFSEFELVFVDQVKLPLRTALYKRMRVLQKKTARLSANNFSTLLLTSKFH